MTTCSSESTNKKVSPYPLIVSGGVLWGASAFAVHYAFFDTDHPFMESVAQAGIATFFALVFYLAFKVEEEMHK
jgi:drug/metabolite transporter (DMT)-like permease